MTPRRRRRGALVLAVGLLAGCTEPPPTVQDDICRIFAQRPAWYDYARRAEARWGTPVPVQMAFMQFESSFRSRARPPRRYLLGILPWRWQSTAYGYAQAKDATWQDYLRANPGPFRKRSDMEDALDFIGWYNDQSTRRLGLAPNDAYALYLAYHEGWTGYRRGDWRRDGPVRSYAARVAARAKAYAGQLAQCRERLRCGRWYQIWPLCRHGQHTAP